jgi:hypothetical protein
LQFLYLGEPDPRPADLDHEDPHPVVRGGPPQPLKQVLQTRLAHGEQRGHWVGRRYLRDAVRQVKLKD